jgi:hypothetical protein
MTAPAAAAGQVQERQHQGHPLHPLLLLLLLAVLRLALHHWVCTPRTIHQPCCRQTLLGILPKQHRHRVG